MKQFQEALKPLQMKLSLQKFLSYFCKAMFVWAVLGFLLMIVSRLVFLPDVFLWIGGSFFVALFGAILATLVNPIIWKEVVSKADDMGGLQVMMTTYELLEKENRSTIENLVIEKGFTLLEEENFSKKYVLQLPNRLLYVMGCILILTVCVGFLPVPRTEEVAVYSNLKLETVESLLKELDTLNLPKEEKAEIKEVLKNLQKELKTASEKSVSEKAIQEAQEALKALEKNGTQKDIQSISQALQNHSATNAFAQAINGGTSADMQQSLQELLENFAEMSMQEKMELAESMGDLSSMMGNQSLMSAFSMMQSALSGSDGASMSETLQGLQELLSEAMQQQQSLQEALQEMNQSLGASDGAGAGNGMGEGTGEGEGSGSGMGEGAGLGGSGVGSGSGEYEGEYEREAYGQGSYQTKVDGTDHETNQTTYTEQKIMGSDGVVVPYMELFVDYQTQALEVLEQENVPYGMRELVSTYFSTLEQ